MTADRPSTLTAGKPSKLRRGKPGFSAPGKWTTFVGFNGVKIFLSGCGVRLVKTPDEADKDQSAFSGGHH